jgi:AcrR family transcriptional regulator
MSLSREYRSEKREKQAEETRRAILHAARALFGQRGYAATPLTEIAKAAGVSVPTLYASVGSKSAIALSLVELVDEDEMLHAIRDDQRSATTGAELIARNAHFVRMLKERCGDIMRALMSAAGTDPEVIPAMQAILRYHRDAQLAVAAHLAELGALRSGVDETQAGAILATINSPDVFTQFMRTEGWSIDRVEEWMGQTLPVLLLA